MLWACSEIVGCNRRLGAHFPHAIDFCLTMPNVTLREVTSETV
jgi:hypothetical protein